MTAQPPVTVDAGPGTPLCGLRILECASFVAGPSAGMTLAQLGADVIRVDPVGGAPDGGRWPLSKQTGTSLYWSSLNKGKRSILVDLRSPRGRELVLALATAPGRGGGVLIDNHAGRPWLSYDELVSRRADMIQVHIQGRPDGRPAVDYTVNPEVGVPNITGPVGVTAPVNHVFPAWDMLTGMLAATGLLAAIWERERTARGAYFELALADVALAGVANLGWLAEADEQEADRPRIGNHLYGSFGVDFSTLDNHRVMVVALTRRHWDALVAVTSTREVFAALEEALGVDLSREHDRYRMRETIASVLRPWFLARPLATVTDELDTAQVLWSRYRTMTEAVQEFRRSDRPSVLTMIEQPGIGPMLAATSPLRGPLGYGVAERAPLFGEHTDEVLAETLGLSDEELGRLHDRNIIGGMP